MESNAFDVNHLDSGVLLPSMERLLTGLKRQNSDLNSSGSPGCEFSFRLNKLMKLHSSRSNVLNEEIVEASRNAAIEAIKVAEAARATAEEKAAKAAQAVVFAKSALALVDAKYYEDTAETETYLKKNKSKKHVTVQTLYSNQ